MFRKLAWTAVMLAGAWGLARAGEGGEAPAGGAAAEVEEWFRRLEVELSATAVLQGSAGAEEPLSPDGDTTDGTASVEITVGTDVGERGRAFLWLTAGRGDGVDAEVPTLSGFNADADDDESVRLYELWYEHRLWEGRGTVRVGKVDLTGPCGCSESGFDANAAANDECRQFLSPGFVNSLAVEFPDDSALGAILWAAPDERVDIGVAFADAEADWDNVFDSVFAMLEVDVRPDLMGRPGTWRVYAWLNDKEHVEIADPAEDKEEGYGVGVSFDQELSDGVTAFLRYGWQRDDVYEVEHAVSLGVELSGKLSGKLFGRENDRLGLAWGVAMLGADAEDALEAAGGDASDEHHVELYYSIAAGGNLFITPDVQWVGNPNGDGGNDDVWALGVRAQIEF